MFKLDDDLLISLGLGDVAPGLKNLTLQTIYEQLEMNVGFRLASRMSNQQLDEFEGFIDANDETGALRWLETNFPDYKAVVADSLEDLKAEIRRDLARVRTVLGAPAMPPPRLIEAATSDPSGNGDAARALASSTGLPHSLATRLLERYGSAEPILAAPDDELLAIPGLGPARLAALRALATPGNGSA
jgi:DNA integrity scanning protein DisA with diadenylate cyclase activity